MTTPSALTIIRAEHQALAAILHALRHTLCDIRDHGAKPNFEVLRSLLFYVDAYPERLHHPKETDHLFKRLRERSSQAAEVLAAGPACPDRRGLAFDQRRLRVQPRPADRPQAGEGIRGAVQPHRQPAAGAAGVGFCSLN